LEGGNSLKEKTTTLQFLIDKNTSKEAPEITIDSILKNPGLISELLDVIETDSGKIKYACANMLGLLAEARPSLLVPYSSRIIDLLDAKNAFIRWGIIPTIAFLMSSDRFFSLLQSESMIPAANLIKCVPQLVFHRPEWEQDIINRLLDLESHTYFYKGQPSPECKNIVYGHIIDCFGLIFPYSAYQAKLIQFVASQTSNSRKTVAKKAQVFLKKHVPVDKPLPAQVYKKAYAKVNLFLNVVGKRPDGYHDLEMINARIDLCDDLTLTIGGYSLVSIRSNDKFLENQNNLVYNIARHLLETYSPEAHVTITLIKRIPVGAGLGGNSADAAAVMLGLNELFGWHLLKTTMHSIALRFGADIPYCLETTPALVEGIGEKITPIALNLSEYRVLIVNPKVFVSTEAVFHKGDTTGYVHCDIAPVVDAIKRQDVEGFINCLHNSLEAVTFTISPETQKAYSDICLSLGHRGVVMTGSGSTILKVTNDVSLGVLAFCDRYSDKYLINIYNFL
jgi:4-diphosphocytidyl-2-C-methyl-D-erythritol kinase